MAISGGAVPCLEVWLQDGKLMTGYNTHANGAVVIDDVAEVYRLISEDKKVFMHRYGDNFVRLRDMVMGLSKG